MIVLSHYQAAELLAAKNAGRKSVSCSPDLNLSVTEVTLDSQFAVFNDQTPLPWTVIDTVAGQENACFRVDGEQLIAIRAFSETFNRSYSLYPTENAPTMLVSGIPMHRIKGTDPWADTQAKITALGKAAGRILDTATGLGYTAILASETAEQVVTIEIDPAAQEIARQNPWSARLFEQPNIEQVIGDSYEEIGRFEDGAFSAIIHDPPVFGLAGDLYSLDFYRQGFRVLTPKGRFFHYIGNPDSRSGAGTTRGVVRRLKEAGFRRVEPRPEAFGVLAVR